MLELTIAELKIINWGINLCDYKLSRHLTESEILKYRHRQVKPRPALCGEQLAAEAHAALAPWHASHEMELTKAKTKGYHLRKALGGLRKIKPFGDIVKIHATTSQINLLH